MRSDAWTVCSASGPSRVGARETEAPLVHFTRFSAPLAGAELCLFAVAINSPIHLGLNLTVQFLWASLVAQTGKNLPTMQENWVRSLGREEPLE